MSEPVTRFTIELPEGTSFSATARHVVTVSPDGRHVAYVANQQIYLRRLDRMEATPVRGTEGTSLGRFGRSPFFSSDSQWLGFWANGQLQRVSVGGGAPVALGQAGQPWGVSWGPDDTILFGQGSEGIWQVSGAGGTPQVLISVGNGEQAHGPQMLPGGEWVLFTLRPRPAADWDQAQIVVQSLATRDRAS